MMMASTWKWLFSATIFKTVDLLFPPRCVECGGLGARFCPSCSASIQWINAPYCQRCGMPVSSRKQHSCNVSNALFEMRSAAIFAGPVRKALHRLKYRYDPSLAWDLIQLAAPYCPAEEWKIDFLVPIPLGKKRKRDRQYNQSELLGNVLSQTKKIESGNRLLERVRETRSQVGLNIVERKENIRAAFHAQPVRGKRILLIDDVCTTGSTLESAAMALREAGAAAVYGFSIARAIPSFLLELR